MTYNQGCDSTAQPMRAGGSDISQRAGSQGSWTTGLLHINSMGSNQASNPHPRVWPLSRIAPGRSYWADAGTVSSGSPSPAKCCWSQQPRPGSGVRGGREAVRGGGRPPGSSSTSRGRLPAPVAEGPAPGPGGSQSGRSGDGGRKSTERSVGTASATRMRSLTSRTGRPPASTSSRTSTSRTLREDHRRPEPGLVREPVVLPGQVQLLRERLGMRRGPPRGVRAVRGGSAMTVGPPAVPAEPVGLPPRAFPATCSPPSGGAPPHRAGSAT